MVGSILYQKKDFTRLESPIISRACIWFVEAMVAEEPGFKLVATRSI